MTSLKRKKREIYLVSGKTGEYADHVEWNVRAFLNGSNAFNFADRLNGWAEENKVSDYNQKYLRFGTGKFVNPLDPDMRLDQNGVKYFVVTVPFGGAPR